MALSLYSLANFRGIQELNIVRLRSYYTEVSDIKKIRCTVFGTSNSPSEPVTLQSAELLRTPWLRRRGRNCQDRDAAVCQDLELGRPELLRYNKGANFW